MPFHDAKYPAHQKVILPKAATVGVSLADGPLLKTSEAAALLGLSPKTLRQLRCDQTGPRFLKMGAHMQARTRYRLTDLEQWVRERYHSVGGGEKQ